MKLLVTGGSGFIGSNFINLILEKYEKELDLVVNLDCLSYASNELNTLDFQDNSHYVFENCDIRHIHDIDVIFKKYNITHVCHFAAESHVDNSISNPEIFIKTNINGTFNLLQTAKDNKVERFHHISTDEVYGELGVSGFFSELSPYNPRNPYAASKASSDFLVRSFSNTYDLPITISNCSNNFGPRQHHEKFIPTIIKSLANGNKVPIYGNGKNIRDWIYVTDHCEAIWRVITLGVLGETYCIGSMCEKNNLEIVDEICIAMGIDPSKSIEFVNDRPGHDKRYAIDNSKIISKLGWKPVVQFSKGIEKTLEWYSEKF